MLSPWAWNYCTWGVFESAEAPKEKLSSGTDWWTTVDCSQWWVVPVGISCRRRCLAGNSQRRVNWAWDPSSGCWLHLVGPSQVQDCRRPRDFCRLGRSGSSLIARGQPEHQWKGKQVQPYCNYSPPRCEVAGCCDDHCGPGLYLFPLSTSDSRHTPWSGHIFFSLFYFSLFFVIFAFSLLFLFLYEYEHGF